MQAQESHSDKPSTSSSVEDGGQRTPAQASLLHLHESKQTPEPLRLPCKGGLQWCLDIAGALGMFLEGREGGTAGPHPRINCG